MNKKGLSVVMAGAMLATSVAPVLAAEEVTATEVQKGTLINELTNKLWEAPRFSAVNDDSVGEIDKQAGGKLSLVGLSTYAIKIDGKIVDTISEKTNEDAFVKSDLQKEIQTAINALKAGDKVELVDLGSRPDGDKVLSTESTTKYTEAELANTGGEVATEVAKLDGDVVVSANSKYVAGKGYVIALNTGIDMNKDGKNETEIVLAVGDDRLDFTKYLDKTNNYKETAFATSSIASKFGGFAKAAARNTDIADKVETTYKIATDGTTLALSDLFNGVMLTEKGQSLLDDAKAVKAVLAMKEKPAKDEHIVRVGYQKNVLSTEIDKLVADKEGVYTLKLQIAKATKVAEEIKTKGDWTTVQDDTFYNTYYVTSKSKAELKKVLNWLDKLSADVDVLAGSNRYETAVKIAKEVVGIDGVGADENIVLVNGDSIVDGLAAAPLAADKGNAPILLTESDKLPTATKKYLAELVDATPNKKVTVNIVGGKSVVTTAVEKELKAMNLKVVRFGGDNREETSMAVAKEVDSNLESAFVVGATGEADAMSIAGYAAQETTPIIVSSVHGLSDETVYELEGATLNVIGGEKAVSAEEFDALKSVALTVDRVAGANRKATNAAVINKFYNADFADTEAVVVAKDDVLIDALTASNLASVKHAPIVLATNSLSAEQVDAIAKNADTTSKARKVYQVGYGVDRDNVVKLVAQSLGLI